MICVMCVVQQGTSPGMNVVVCSLSAMHVYLSVSIDVYVHLLYQKCCILRVLHSFFMCCIQHDSSVPFRLFLKEFGIPSRDITVDSLPRFGSGAIWSRDTLL